ncbi:efflux RND transporter periplasmic adaptor subunit [Flaviaesturariibacter amylovorans]|uniref:Multidrug efflux RND transporter periplasmic adaptor MexH n=1 Tax=Flaviaesturariibacter amylovorans TaxID=1084520 RepID=A0ABP8GJX5_9BACT
MRKNRIVRVLVTLALVAAAIGGIAAVLQKNKQKNAAKTAIVSQAGSDVAVRVSTVQRRQLEAAFNVNGNFAPAQQVNLASENAGRVTRVLVDEGSFVRTGQTLAVIEMDQLNIDVESAEAAYQSALRDQQRFENAIKSGGVTQQQVDQVRLQATTAKSRLEQARIRAGNSSVRSSISGIVNKRMVEPGMVVNPGTALFELVDVSRLKLAVTVNETQVAALKVGAPVQVKASVFPDRSFTGNVTFIAPKADAALNFPVEITLAANPGNVLRAGMYGTALFDFPQRAPSLVVPRTAFVGSTASNQVFVLDSSNVARLRPVVAGRTIGEEVEILQGLNEGDVVITSGQINLRDGSKVAPLK